jgi:hypothetical protein
MKKVYFFIFCFIFSSYSQEYMKGSVLLKNSTDTLFGTVKNTSQLEKSKKVNFKSQKGEKRVFEADEVQFYSVGVESFKRFNIQNDAVFLKEIIVGYLSFYTLSTKISERYFIFKNDMLLELSKVTYMQQISKSCNDCKQIDFKNSDQIEKKYPFGESGIFKLVKDYNYWMFSEQSIAVQEKGKYNVAKNHFGVFFGQDFSAFMSNAGRRNIFREKGFFRTMPGDNSFFVGLQYQKGLPKGFFLNVQPIFFKGSYNWINKSDKLNGDWAESFDFSIMKIPIGLGLKFFRSKKTQINFNLNRSYSVVLNDEKKFFSNVNVPFEIATRNLWTGTDVNLGIERPIYKLIFFMNGNYSTVRLVSKISAVTGVGFTKGFQYRVGVMF